MLHVLEALKALLEIVKNFFGLKSEGLAFWSAVLGIFVGVMMLIKVCIPYEPPYIPPSPQKKLKDNYYIKPIENDVIAVVIFCCLAVLFIYFIILK